MIEKLESLKKIGMYAVQLWFGSQDVGCDDGSVPMMERSLVLIAVPVGCLGETKIMYRGSVADFMDFNFAQSPKILSNPPKESEYKDDGYYIWGTERMAKNMAEKLGGKRPYLSAPK